jgi:hypothetical protein
MIHVFIHENCQKSYQSLISDHVNSTYDSNKNFFFFFDMSTQENGGIRACDLRFIRRGLQPIELPLGTIQIKILIVIGATERRVKSNPHR